MDISKLKYSPLLVPSIFLYLANAFLGMCNINMLGDHHDNDRVPSPVPSPEYAPLTPGPNPRPPYTTYTYTATLLRPPGRRTGVPGSLKTRPQTHLMSQNIWKSPNMYPQTCKMAHTCTYIRLMYSLLYLFPGVSLRFRAGSGEHVAPAENTLNVPNHMKIVKHVAPDLYNGTHVHLYQDPAEFGIFPRGSP